MYDRELRHYGVMGMKWGKRTSRPLGGSSKSGGKTKKKPVKKKLEQGMSDEELRSKVNRLQMEKQYKQLVREIQPRTIDRRKRYASNTLKVVGATAAASSAIATLYNNSKTIREMLDKWK